MIEITLKFATVALAAAALNQLNGSQAPTATVVDTGTPATSGKPKAETKPAAPASAPGPAVDSAAKPKSGIDYPTLQKAVFKLAGISRDEASAMSKQFGVSTFKELNPSKWDEAFAAVNAKIEELNTAVPW